MLYEHKGRAAGLDARTRPFTKREIIKGIHQSRRTIVETALGSAQLKALEDDERKQLESNANAFRSAINELAKILLKHPHDSVQLHGLHELEVLLLTSFMIGNRGAINPIVERLETNRKKAMEEARAENARRSRDLQSEEINKEILECALPLRKLRPALRRSAEATAKAVIESGKISHLNLKVDAVRKRIAALEKDGRLCSDPDNLRTTG